MTPFAASESFDLNFGCCHFLASGLVQRGALRRSNLTANQKLRWTISNCKVPPLCSF